MYASIRGNEMLLYLAVLKTGLKYLAVNARLIPEDIKGIYECSSFACRVVMTLRRIISEIALVNRQTKKKKMCYLACSEMRVEKMIYK